MTFRLKKYRIALLVLTLVAGLPWLATRPPILRTVGTILVYEDPLDRADVIVVGLDAAESGALEAADLVQEGLADRVVVLAEPAGRPAIELARRGVAYEEMGTRIVALLHSLGVQRAELLRLTAGGTGVSSRNLTEWSHSQQIRSMILVTSADHSRRFKRVLRRNMPGPSPRVSVRVSRYSDFDIDDWWRTRDGVRVAVVELQKLFLDIVRHPFS